MSGYGQNSDHDCIGAVVATITCNMLELVDLIKMINTVQEENREAIKTLIENIKMLKDGFLDLFEAMEPKNPSDKWQESANKIGCRSERILDPIINELGMQIHHENLLSDQAKVVDTAVNLFLDNVKSLENSCNDKEDKNLVIFLDLFI